MSLNRAEVTQRIITVLLERKEQGVFVGVTQRSMKQLHELNEVMNDQMPEPFDLTKEEIELLDIQVKRFNIQAMMNAKIENDLLMPAEEILHRHSLTQERKNKHKTPTYMRAFLLILADALTQTKGFYR